MADRYLLESGAPDGYTLEDASGVLLLEGTSEFGFDGDEGWYGIGTALQVALAATLLAGSLSAQQALPAPNWDAGEIAAAEPLGGSVTGRIIIRGTDWAFQQPPQYDNGTAEYPTPEASMVEFGEWSPPAPWPVITLTPPPSGDAEGVELYAVPEDQSAPRYDAWPFVPPSQPVFDAGEIAYIPPEIVEFGEWSPPAPWIIPTLTPPPSGDAEGVQLYAVPDDTAPPRFDVWPVPPPTQPTADEVIVPQPIVLNVTEDEFRPPQQQRGTTRWILQGTSGPTGAVAPPPGPFAGDDEPLLPRLADSPLVVLPAPWAWHTGNDLPDGLPDEPDWRPPLIWLQRVVRLAVPFDSGEWVPVQTLNPESDEWRNPVAPSVQTFAVPAPHGWEQHETSVLVVFPLPPDEDFYRAGPETIPPVTAIKPWLYEQQDTAVLWALPDEPHAVPLPAPVSGSLVVPNPWAWEHDVITLVGPPEEDHFLCGPQFIPSNFARGLWGYEQQEWLPSLTATEDYWQNPTIPEWLKFSVPAPWLAEINVQAFGLITNLPLHVQDRSGYRYGVLDQSGKRYLVVEKSSVRYVMEDESDV